MPREIQRTLTPETQTQYSFLLCGEQDCERLAAGIVPDWLRESAQKAVTFSLQTLPTERPWDKTETVSACGTAADQHS